MPQTPPPYANITGISRAAMKDNAQESFINYDGNARPGELVVNLTDYTLWIGNAQGALNPVGSGTAAPMYSVTVNSSGLFVAVGMRASDSAPIYATSSNGSTWTTPALMNGSATLAAMVSVTVNSSGLFVAVGYDSSNAPVYATSSNGSTWTTPARMNGSATAAYMRSIAVNSAGLFAAVGGFNNYVVSHVT